MQYRHEWKHEINRSDMLAIRQRLRAVAEPDPYAIDGKTRIRSLYFDNAADKALREKVDGVNMREKFRIRYYNGDTSYIKLEKKSKNNGLGTKYAARITAEEAQALVDGDLSWMQAELDKPPVPDALPGGLPSQKAGQYRRELVAELYSKMRGQGLRPRTIVDYTREPYVYAPGNVRVTFDYDIRTGLGCTDLLNWDCPTVPAGDAGIILEVKWDNYLPEVIRSCVATPGRRVSAFSKYAQCRIYD